MVKIESNYSSMPLQFYSITPPIILGVTSKYRADFEFGLLIHTKNCNALNDPIVS